MSVVEQNESVEFDWLEEGFEGPNFGWSKMMYLGIRILGHIHQMELGGMELGTL